MELSLIPAIGNIIFRLYSESNSLPAYSVILTMIAGAAPKRSVFPVEVNGINRAAGAVAKAEGIAHFL